MNGHVVKLRIAPVSLKVANEFVERLHRHSGPVRGHKFAVSVVDDKGELRGIAIVGRPVSRMLDNGIAAEITRVCTDGTMNVCSMLYAAATKAARAMGMRPIYTYTLKDEGGGSLRGAGFLVDLDRAGGKSDGWHSRAGRKIGPVGDDVVGGKIRWVAP